MRRADGRGSYDDGSNAIRSWRRAATEDATRHSSNSTLRKEDRSAEAGRGGTTAARDDRDRDTRRGISPDKSIAIAPVRIFGRLSGGA